MRIADWARGLASHPSFKELLAPLETSCEWLSLPYEARPLILAAELHARPRTAIVVTPNYERALQWEAKLRLCGIPADRIKQLPSGSSSLFEDAAPEESALSDRLGALRALTLGEPCVILATPQSALERTLPPDVLRDAFFDIRPGEELDLEDFVRRLGALGYEHQEPVRLPGHFSRRGGIVDVYASGQPHPVRIELFGDEVESIRAFDPNTQRSILPMDGLRLSPSRETMYTEEDAGLVSLLLATAAREASSLPETEATRLEELIQEDASALSQRVYFDRLDLYRPLLHPDSGCALDLLDESGLLVLDEPMEIEAVSERAHEELGQALEARAARGEILHSPVGDYMLPHEHLSSRDATLALSSMNAPVAWFRPSESRDFEAVSLETYRARPEALGQNLKNYLEAGFQVMIGTDQPHRARSVLEQIEVFPASLPQERGAMLAEGNLAGGFAFPQAKLAVLTDAELFGVARLKLPQKRFTEGMPLATVLDLKPGDYVVHIHFGIGVFRGLIKREELGVEKEYLYIEYRHPDKLFVPADQLDRVQKYLNPGDVDPKLNKLTGNEWQRAISKAKEDAREFARELLQLYGKRKAAVRPPHGPDTPWQAEMESTFPWVETPSQHRAIEDVKRDLRQEYPMDRLVCGDVGFGKTEVAIRAAFKVVQEQRQVAVLCPTTILSEQHFRNFSERLAPFGVRLALLNRFRGPQEKRQVLDDLREGRVDVVLGTHSLLSSEIEFKQLGLVIIDEEQKFGVKQKEALKKLRTEIDVLSMSATPIPRTLSMALMDIRQMSLINDAPPGRLPIRTFLRAYADEVVREALLRELARGGQVFYVYNRIEGIQHIAERLRKIVPTARIGVGHGQMTEKELEPIMIGFIRGEIDILLSTTIIENGIDISNANTLIVENADRLGLSQLYQLRGRVGRSDRQAYAYLLYDSRKTLTEGALQRLQALQEFTSLGAGYSLAFRDLQIRGAGDLLGKKQHGAMAAVGYELYTQLISEAVQIMRQGGDGIPASGELARDPLESLTPLPTFEVPVVALLPDSYIRDQAQRLYYYQKMMSSRDLGALGEIQAEVEDRYGHPPEPVRMAFEIMALRMEGRELGLEKLDAKGGRLAIQFAHREEIPPRVFSILGKRYRDSYLMREGFIWPYSGDPVAAIRIMLGAFREAHAQYLAEKAALELQDVPSTQS